MTHIVEVGGRCQRPRRPRHRPQFRDGQRVAVRHALTAAKIFLHKIEPTVKAAARACGSNVPYVRAALVLLEVGNPVLMTRVLVGQANLLEAARDAQHLAGLVKAYRTAAPADHIEFARLIGPDALFDGAVAPAADRERFESRQPDLFASIAAE